MTTKGSGTTPQHCANRTAEKLINGMTPNPVRSYPVVCKYIYTPRQTSPMPVRIDETTSNTLIEFIK